MGDEDKGAKADTGSAADGTPDPKKGAAAGTGTSDAADKKTDTAAAKGTTDAAADTGTSDKKTDGQEQPAQKTGAPEKYALTIPEDAALYLDEADVATFEAAGRKYGWTNDEAQAAMVDHAASVADIARRFHAETAADPTYGGKQLVETQRLAKAAIDLIRPTGHARRDGFLRFLRKAGAENNLEVVSFLADLGRRAGEDTPVGGRDRGDRKQEQPLLARAAEKLYPDKT